MMEYLEFETTPANEDCVQVSRDTDYYPAMKAEAHRFLEMMNKRYPKAPGYFALARCDHDFGPYLELRYKFDEDEDGWDWANFIESTFPLTWDDNEVMEYNGNTNSRAKSIFEED